MRVHTLLPILQAARLLLTGAMWAARRAVPIAPAIGGALGAATSGGVGGGAASSGDDLFRILVEDMTEAVCVYRGETRLFVNQAFVDLYGYASAGEALADPLLARLAEGARRSSEMERAPRKRMTRRTLVRPDGQERQLEVSTTDFSYQDSPAGFVVIRDVTREANAQSALMESEGALREQEERYRLLFESAPVGLAINRWRGEWLDANPALASMLGYERGELIGKRMGDFRPAGYVRRGRFDELEAGAIPEIFDDHVTLLRKDGTPIDARVRTVGKRDESGALTYSYRMVEDISEQVRAEEARREIEERYALLFDHAPLGISIDDTDKILMANEALAGILGRRIDEIAGHQLGVFAVRDPDRSGGSRYRQLREGKLDALEEERQFERPDGSRVWANVRTFAVRHPDGAFRYSFRLVEDITERKQAESEVAEREERFSAVVENMADAVAVLAKDRRLFVNGAYLDLFGYNSVEEALADPPRSRISGEREVPAAPASTGSLPPRRQLQVHRPDGAVRTVEVASAPVTYEGVAARSVIIRDVTEREKTVEALRDSEGRLRAVVDNMLDGVCVTRGDRRLFANQAIVDLFGYSDAETGLADPAWRGAHPDDVRDTEDTSPPERYRLRVIRPDGTTRQTEVASARVMFEGDPARLSVVRDITEHEEVAGRLQASEERFRRLFETAPVGIAVCQTDGTIIETNEALGRLLGYEAEELVGHQLREMRHPDWEEGAGDRWRAMDRGELASFQIDRPFVRKDGAEVWLRLTTGGTMLYESGERAVYRIAEDITEQRRATEALSHSEARHRAIVEAIPDLFFVVGRDGVYRDVVRGSSGIMTSRPEEMIGRPMGGERSCRLR